MTDSAMTPAGEPLRWAGDDFVGRLRAQGTRYHNLHPFHVRMDAGDLSRDELQRWVANRFYYQECIPIKDAASPLQLPRDRGASRVDPADRRPRRHGGRDGRDRVVAAPSARRSG